MHRLSRHAAALRRSAPELRPAAAADEEAAEDARTPVCLVIGAGAGIGQGVAIKFAAEGYHACVVRRGGGPSSLSDDSTPGKFEEFVQGLRDAGGEATAFFANGCSQPPAAAPFCRCQPSPYLTRRRAARSPRRWGS